MYGYTHRSIAHQKAEIDTKGDQELEDKDEGSLQQFLRSTDQSIQTIYVLFETVNKVKTLRCLISLHACSYVRHSINLSHIPPRIVSISENQCQW